MVLLLRAEQLGGVPRVDGRADAEVGGSAADRGDAMKAFEELQELQRQNMKKKMLRRVGVDVDVHRVVNASDARRLKAAEKR